MIFDMHCHTAEGSPDAVVTLEQTITKLKEKGFNGMLVSDHDSYNGYKSLKRMPNDFLVLRGVEYDSLDGGHLLIVLPSCMKYDIFEYRGMRVIDVIKIVHALGGIVGPAHPYDYSKLGFCNTKNKDNAEILAQFDFIETFNACLYKKSSILSEYLAKEYNKPCFGGSDSHTTAAVGLGYTNLKHDICNEDDLIALVKQSDFNSFEASGEFFERKHERLHSISIMTGGYMYGVLNSCLAYRHKNDSNIILKALGV